jgi:hypothetical protein
MRSLSLFLLTLALFGLFFLAGCSETFVADSRTHGGQLSGQQQYNLDNLQERNIHAQEYN